MCLGFYEIICLPPPLWRWKGDMQIRLNQGTKKYVCGLSQPTYCLHSQWTTACGHRMAYRKWKESKQQPSMLPDPAVPGCCLLSFHILWGKLSTRTVDNVKLGRGIEKVGPFDVHLTHKFLIVLLYAVPDWHSTSNLSRLTNPLISTHSPFLLFQHQKGCYTHSLIPPMPFVGAVSCQQWFTADIKVDVSKIPRRHSFSATIILFQHVEGTWFINYYMSQFLESARVNWS